MLVRIERDPVSGLEKAETAKLIELDFVPSAEQLADDAKLIAAGKVVDSASVSSKLDDSFSGSEGSVETGRLGRAIKWAFSPGFRSGYNAALLQALTGYTGKHHFINGQGRPLIGGQPVFNNVPYVEVGAGNFQAT